MTSGNDNNNDIDDDEEMQDANIFLINKQSTRNKFNIKKIYQ